MDSRINFMLANKLGFENITTYCYGNPQSEDMKMSSAIAKELSHSHITHHIKNGRYLVNNIIENYLKPSDGIILYTPTATIRHSLDRVNSTKFGQLHTRQTGDTTAVSVNRPDQ